MSDNDNDVEDILDIIAATYDATQILDVLGIGHREMLTDMSERVMDNLYLFEEVQGYEDQA